MTKLKKDANAESVQEQADLVRKCLEQKFMTVKVRATGGVESKSRTEMRIKDEPHRIGAFLRLVFGD